MPGTSFSGEDVPRDNPMPPMAAADAIQLLRLHSHAVRGIGKRSGPRQHEPAIEDVRADILRKIEAMKRGQAASAMSKARDAAQWARRRGPG